MLNKNALELFLTMVNLWPIRFAILYAEKKYKQYNEIPFATKYKLKSDTCFLQKYLLPFSPSLFV